MSKVSHSPEYVAFHFLKPSYAHIRKVIIKTVEQNANIYKGDVNDSINGAIWEMEIKKVKCKDGSDILLLKKVDILYNW